MNDLIKIILIAYRLLIFYTETILHSNKRISCELKVIEYDDFFFFFFLDKNPIFLIHMSIKLALDFQLSW
jgi:hypothetical protein